MERKMIVVSLDALGAEDESIFLNCQRIRSVIDDGVYVPRVESVYPTLTYPAHTTLITGRYPKDHGIVNNTKVQPEREKPDWFWHASDIQGDTLLKAAVRKRKKVGAIFWPVSAGARIDWNMAEIWPNRKWQSQTMVSLQNSTIPFAIHAAKRYGHLLDGINQPNLDDFALSCALDLIENKPFDALFVHLTDIDAHKHQYGMKHEEVTKSVHRTDERVGKILDALEAKGLSEQTDVVLLSDHSQRNIQKALRLNQIFYRHGLLDAKRGKITGWRVFANSAEGIGFIYVKKNEPEVVSFVKDLLHDIRKANGGIDRIYDRSQIQSLGADPRAAFMLTAHEGCVFSNSLKGEIFGTMDNDYRANHGYPPILPHYEAMFAARGPSLKAGHVEHATTPMIDIAPTLAKAMRVELRGGEGAVHENWLKR